VANSLHVRVVLDTNILISACWKPGGWEAKAVGLALSGAVTACVSAQVWMEYEEVLLREKFVAMRPRAMQLLSELEARVVVYPTGERVRASVDDDDNRFLECAAAARAEYLITGNLRHYPAVWEGTKIVNARGFLEAKFP
jgi:putative PIN family toxin of toxin-antitoxin system